MLSHLRSLPNSHALSAFLTFLNEGASNGVQHLAQNCLSCNQCFHAHNTTQALNSTSPSHLRHWLPCNCAELGTQHLYACNTTRVSWYPKEAGCQRNHVLRSTHSFRACNSICACLQTKPLLVPVWPGSHAFLLEGMHIPYGHSTTAAYARTNQVAK